MMPVDKNQLLEIAKKHRDQLTKQIELRKIEMAGDDDGHFFLYHALGIPRDECAKIDLYQNIGRFVYKYAGAIIEEMTVCAMSTLPGSGPVIIKNTVSTNPVNFSIDCYNPADNKAHEIKWRDATTDYDHVRKEHNKIQAIIDRGMIPVRVMFFYPQRSKARRLQDRIIALFEKHGEAYVGKAAWDYVKSYAGTDLNAVIRESIPRVGPLGEVV